MSEEEKEELIEKVHTLEEKYKDIRDEGNELSEKAGKLGEFYSFVGKRIKSGGAFNTKNEEDSDLIGSTNSLLDDEIKKADEMRYKIETMSEDFSPSGTISVAALTTATTMSKSVENTDIEVDYENQLIESIRDDDEKKIRSKLNDLSSGLGDAYRAISEVLYSSSSDGLRAALFQTRQAFDHMLDELAPDDDVRCSEFWEPKQDKEREDNVYRKEKLEYVLDRYPVKNSVTIEKKAKHIRNVYNKLQKLHERNNLDEKETLKSAIFEIKLFLEDLITEMEDFK